MIPFGNFEPDRSIHKAGVTNKIINCKPVADGWGPLPSLQALSEALPGAPRGALTARSLTGDFITVAGTETNLYEVDQAGVWTSIGSGYSVPTGDNWSFELFGNRIIATQLGNPPQYYDIGVSASFAALPGSPPTARFVSVVGDFVVLYGLDGDLASLHWSGLNNSEQWTVGEELSDTQYFPNGGPIHGVIEVVGGSYVLQRDLIRSMAFQPDSAFTFAFRS